MLKHETQIGARLQHVRDLQHAHRRQLYTSLSSMLNQIRILSLRRSNKDNRLCVTLEVVAMIEAGDYTALSYYWGNTNDTGSLWVDSPAGETQFLVTVNLIAALEHLFANGHSRIWADALCINQDDAEERSIQVQKMRVIYSEARSVVAYVGDFDGVELELVSFFNAVSSAQVRSMLFDRSTCRNAVAAFFSQPYWARVWIIQECVVASDIHIMYGNIVIPWKKLKQVVTWMGDMLMPVKQFPGIDVSHTAQVIQLRDVYESEVPIPLLEALKRTHRSLSTEPRDKIFGLLGLSSDSSKLVPIPHYAHSLAACLAEMTVRVMKKEQSLDLICLGSSEECEGTADQMQGERTRPTWVPDWVNIWSKPKTVIEDTILASRPQQPEISIISVATVGLLTVRGHVLGPIMCLSTGFLDKGIQRADFAGTSETYIFRAKRAIVDALSLGTLQEEFNVACFRSLWTTAAHDAGMTDSMREWRDRNATLMVTTLYTLERVASEKIVSEQLTKSVKKKFGDEIFGVIANEPCSADQLANFIKTVQSVLESGLRLMVTTDGIFGMAPDRSRIGDQICDIYGCSGPVILRPATQEGHWTVVGPAYLSSLRRAFSKFFDSPDEQNVGDFTLC